MCFYSINKNKKTKQKTGMGYRPANPDQDNMVISYDSSKDESVKRWEDAVDSYLNRKSILAVA